MTEIEYCAFYMPESHKVINRGVIQKNGFIFAESELFGKKITGIVSEVTENYIRVLFLPGASNMSNYYTIQVSDIVAGHWQLRYSQDLATVFTNIEEGVGEETETG